MRNRLTTAIALFLLICSLAASAQVRLHGRVYGPRVPGSDEVIPFTHIHVIAALEGPNAEPLQFATFETEPVAWYTLSGSAGRYTMLFDSPDQSMRPIILTNLYTDAGDEPHRIVNPKLDYGVFWDRKWDEKAAKGYYQLFTAKGKSLTQVGFRLVHDGVDGEGPGSQNFLLSVHRKGASTPDKWQQVGPTRLVRNVDCGGGKDYKFSAGWNSGEAPLVPGQQYAVYIRPEDPNGKLQAFWWPNEDKSIDCYRIGESNTGWQGHSIHMTVSTDCDGLVIPYNKLDHKTFEEFAGGARKWTQTYVAQGRSLASVIMYGAVSGAQPPLSRQRLRVRVREGGSKGPIVGIEKLAIGTGNYTGDASWGLFGTVYAPGEVPLVPGKTYAIEFESIETVHTLHGFVNIKGMVSDDRAGFNPYRKAPGDAYEDGTSYLEGEQARDYDLDMQVIEYEKDAPNWKSAVDARNLMRNGNMTSGKVAESDEDSGRPTGWMEFSIGSRTACRYIADELDNDNRLLRVTGIPEGDEIVDGGYVQKVGGLSHLEGYRLSGRVRCTWPVSLDRQCFIGYDPTGQTEDPAASTIIWSAPLPAVHGFYVDYQSRPIRPAPEGTEISVWLRARAVANPPWAFKADFDNLKLRRVKNGIPGFD